MNDALFNELTAWIDTSLSAPLPDGIAAFSFNLYDSAETYDLELIGAPAYDPNDPDWACDDIFTSPEPRFEMQAEAFDQSWEACLQAIGDRVQRYLDAGSPGALRMKASEAVGIGFVDGDLQVVWRAA